MSKKILFDNPDYELFYIPQNSKSYKIEIEDITDTEIKTDKKDYIIRNGNRWKDKNNLPGTIDKDKTNELLEEDGLPTVDWDN